MERKSIDYAFLNVLGVPLDGRNDILLREYLGLLSELPSGKQMVD